MLNHKLPTLRKLSYFNPLSWKKNLPRDEAIKTCLIKLGPLFVKFGQVLSTRRDMLPADIADALATLQDKVPPFAGAIAQQMIEQAFGQPIDAIFTEFDLMPLASASIAQVHAATLKNGDKVVVKVLRPKVKRTIEKDIKILYWVAKWFNRLYKRSEYIHANELVQEFEETTKDELNLQMEAANAAQLRKNFLNSPIMYVPKVYWDYVSEKVMVQERIYGVPISDLDTLKKYEVNLKTLAEYGVQIFFAQVFRDRFFHADMHPGNILVDISNPEKPRYNGVDFGIMGSLSPEDQQYLAQNFLAFFNQDYFKMAQLHIDSGWVPADTRVDKLENAFRAICEPFNERPLDEISYGKFLMQLLATAQRFHMHVQPQLFLLQKTLLNVEGLGRQLYPQLDLWETAKPFLEEWMRENLGIKYYLNRLADQLPNCLAELVKAPEKLANFIKQFLA